MFGVIIRSLCAGVAALLIVQGSALGATISFIPASTADDIDANLVLGPQDNFSPNLDHGPGGDGIVGGLLSFVDYYYLNFGPANETVRSVITNPLPNSAIDFADFSLDMFEADLTIANQITFNDLSPVLGTTSMVAGTSIMLTNVLINPNGFGAGDYVLRVAYNSTTQLGVSTYGGQITATPLPPALLIFGTGLFGLGILSRYRRRRRGQLGLEA